MKGKHLINCSLNLKIKELEMQNQRLSEELTLLKSQSKTRHTKKLSPPLRFYLNDRTIRLVKRSIERFKEQDPISGWFVHLLSITGCRGVEMQNVKLTDIYKETCSNGEVFYSIRVNVAKKRSNICIREVVISKSEFKSIMQAHQNYFLSKGKDTRRTYLFQKSKLKFRDNKINITEISKQFKELLIKGGFKHRKSLHILRNIFIASLKSRGYNSFEIKELMKYSSTSEIDNVYGLSSASKIQAYKDIKTSLK
ncbi:tyrosine-type recombinase/integrase [Borrelia puertoricensis]|uniref:tyrosine-type recombinase/integrase n=1 Tax=Borrelia puertoricensis TaxID=2756107 RepID=UPI001FF64DC5|nr:tyrosine-type recombinase/integrase [Borrelia puertoricensis]UPA18668.1 site-specific integrase [Borrelia puertoricensis]